MVQHCDFVEQPTTDDGDGRVLRPDVLVKLPGGKSHRRRLEGAARRVSGRVRDDVTTRRDRRRGATTPARCASTSSKLGQKAYWRAARRRRPEFVVMFLPTSRRWPRGARRSTRRSHELALSNNVIPASPTNLIGLLRAVHYGWQQETIAEGARQISDLGRELYKRLSTMGAHVSKLGTVARRRRQVLQRDGRLARAAGAAAGAPLRAARHHRHRAARAHADRAPDAGRSRARARRGDGRAAAPVERARRLTWNTRSPPVVVRTSVRGKLRRDRGAVRGERRSERDRDRRRPRRLHGGAVRGPREPRAARDRGVQLGRPADDHVATSRTTRAMPTASWARR